ncbi:MAG: hypothetical protein ACLFVR_00665 [Thiohalospira sp.]
MNRERVYYYSKYDGACYSNLMLAENVLSNFKDDNEYDINDIIELYQVKLYIDNEIFLKKWTKVDIEDIKEKCKRIWSVIITFWQKINGDNISVLFNHLECWTLQDSFWEITEKLKVYKNIDEIAFNNILQLKDISIRAILHQEKIVKYYSNVLRDFLIGYEKSAELILTQYVEKHDRDRKDLYFPNNLSLKDREDIILSYLDSDDPNLNYVRLVLNIKKQSYINISDKTRLKAKKLENKLNNEIINQDTAVKFGINIIFDEKQEKAIKVARDGNSSVYSYSTNFIKKIDHPLAYLSHFVNLFNYIDNQSCISMVSKDADFDVMEKMFMSSKNEYKTGFVFNHNENLSLGQIYLYDTTILKAQNQSVEQIVKYFISEYIGSKYGLRGFRFNLPSSGTSYLEKIRTLLAEFDVLLRQYKLYREDSEIDYELLCMSSNSYNFSDIPSFISNKYYYQKEDRLAYINYLLFSDQSGLSYVDPFKSKYHCLFDLLVSENMPYDNFEEWKKDRMKPLLKEDYLFINSEGILKIENENKLFILSQLYKKEVLSYWHYSKECQAIIDEMTSKDILYFENTLFNKLERDYFNYYLNKKDFTNGLDLRNSFMHGTNTMSEGEQVKLYYALLRIIVLTVLKIEDDQLLKNKVESINEIAR